MLVCLSLSTVFDLTPGHLSCTEGISMCALSMSVLYLDREGSLFSFCSSLWWLLFPSLSWMQHIPLGRFLLSRTHTDPGGEDLLLSARYGNGKAVPSSNSCCRHLSASDSVRLLRLFLQPAVMVSPQHFLLINTEGCSVNFWHLEIPVGSSFDLLMLHISFDGGDTTPSTSSSACCVPIFSLGGIWSSFVFLLSCTGMVVDLSTAQKVLWSTPLLPLLCENTHVDTNRHKLVHTSE